jgi:hypothetical protein
MIKTKLTQWAAELKPNELSRRHPKFISRYQVKQLK